MNTIQPIANHAPRPSLAAAPASFAAREDGTEP